MHLLEPNTLRKPAYDRMKQIQKKAESLGIGRARFPAIVLKLLMKMSLNSEFELFCYEHCGGLNEDGPQRVIYLNTWSPVGGTSWEGLGGVAF